MRSGSASLVLVTVGACATSPARLPPPNAPPAYQPAPPAAPGPDTPLPAEPPVIRERYGLLTSAIDLLAVIPLVAWTFEPADFYLAVPTLLAVPLVHAAKGQSEHAGLSLLGRAAVLGAIYLAADADRDACEGGDLFCYPGRTSLAITALLVPLITIDALFARTEHLDDSWLRLPSLGVSTTAEGGRVLTLGGAF